MARLTSVLLFAAAVLPYAFATNCNSGEFFFSERSCCLPHGGQPNPPSPPSGITCPTNGWYWHTDNECCVPKTPQTPSSPAPSCSSDCIWSSLDLHCKRQPSTPSSTPTKPATSSTPTKPTSPATPSSSSDCQDGHFFFQPKSCCLPHGGQPNPPSPPAGTTCPTNGWYWHSDNQCCVPSTPQTPSSPAPSCDKDCIWSSLDLRCSPQPSSSKPVTPTTPAAPSKPSSSSPAQPSSTCGPSEFYFGDKQCCLPHGGMPNPPSPPHPVTCPPSGWYWHTGKQCCVPSTPQTPSSPPPQCEKGCNWSPGDLKCYPQPPTTTSTPPKPSGYAGHKRHAKSRAITLCPSPMTACPIKGLMSMSGDYECFDTEVELTSCGGCASTGAGQDCTAIPNAWNVGCNKGQCQVTTCAQGFKPSSDAKSCIAF